MKTIATIGFIILCLLTIIFRADDIEADLQRRSLETLKEANISTVKVDIDGRDAILSGMVSSLDIKDKSEKLISEVYGIRSVKNQIALEKDVSVTSSFFNLKFHPDFIDLVGLLPDSASRKKLIEQVKQAFKERNLKIDLDVDAEIEKPEKLEAVLTGLKLIMDQIKVDEISFRQDTLLFSGILENSSLKKEYDEKIKAFDIPGVITISQFSSSHITSEVEYLPNSLIDLLSHQSIEFASNSSKIRNESEAILDQISEILLQNPSYQIKIVGYTDSTGSSQWNLSLSQNRAESVRSYLIARGVKSELLSVQGYGEKRPVANNNTTEGRRKNRRVEFIVEKGKTP